MSDKEHKGTPWKTPILGIEGSLGVGMDIAAMLSSAPIWGKVGLGFVGTALIWDAASCWFLRIRPSQMRPTIHGANNRPDYYPRIVRLAGVIPSVLVSAWLWWGNAVHDSFPFATPSIEDNDLMLNFDLSSRSGSDRRGSLQYLKAELNDVAALAEAEKRKGGPLVGNEGDRMRRWYPWENGFRPGGSKNGTVRYFQDSRRFERLALPKKMTDYKYILSLDSDVGAFSEEIWLTRDDKSWKYKIKVSGPGKTATNTTLLERSGP